MFPAEGAVGPWTRHQTIASLPCSPSLNADALQPEALSDLSLEETTFLGSCDRLGSHIANLPTLGHHMSPSLAVTGTPGGLTEPRHIPQHSLNPEKALGTMAVDWLMENKIQTQALSSPGMSREQGGRGQLSPCPRLFWPQDTGHWFWNQRVATRSLRNSAWHGVESDGLGHILTPSVGCVIPEPGAKLSGPHGPGL